MPEPAKLDWQKIIAETGITPYKLALMAGIDKKTMAAYASGRREPRHSVGQWLLMLKGEKIPPLSSEANHIAV